MKVWRPGTVFLFLVFAYFFAVSAFAQQKAIELTYGTPFGADHVFSQVAKRWFEKIEKETGGKVKIKPYWGGTLLSAREGIEEVLRGVVDIGVVIPDYARTGYHIAKANFIFFHGADQTLGTKVFWEVFKKFPEIEKEYQGLKVLSWTSGVDYQLLSRKPIGKMEDIRGARIKAPVDFGPVFKALGAELVVVPMSETYEQMQKGIFQGAFISLEGLKSFRLAEVGKYVIYFDFYKPHAGREVMNLNTWNKLPDDVKKVFEANINWLGIESDREMEKLHKEGFEFGKQQGVEFIRLPKEEMEKFYAPLRVAAKAKAEELDKLGLPGTKMYNEVQRLIQQYKK